MGWVKNKGSENVFAEGGKVDEKKRTIKEARKEKRNRIQKAKELKREGKFSKEFIQDMKIKARREKQDKVREARRNRKR